MQFILKVQNMSKIFIVLPILRSFRKVCQILFQSPIFLCLQSKKVLCIYVSYYVKWLLGNLTASFLFAGMDSKSAAISPIALTEAQLKIHAGWVSSWQNVIIDLDTYVREYHPRGLKWKKGN